MHSSRPSAVCWATMLGSMHRRVSHHTQLTPLWAVNALTFFASVSTGVIWNGVAFIAKHDYGYDRIETLTLYVVLGVVYVVGALSTGKALRLVQRWISPRSMLMLILLTQAITCTGPLFTEAGWMLWVVACANSLLPSWLWPIVESYLTAGRYGSELRKAIGWWNICWTSAVALSLIAMAPLVEENARMTLVWLGALNVIAMSGLLLFKRSPGGQHGETAAAAAVPLEYPYLLHAARMLLPLSYVLTSAMSPLLPYLFERLDLSVWWETPVAATWMTVRVLTMAFMWRLGFWHGRWGTLLLGAMAMTLGFGVVVMGISLPMMLAGLGLFGIGMGIIYYAALYYAMTVGHGAVDAGGKHEALIGVGYALGPATGFAGILATSQAKRMGLVLWDGAGVVGATWLLIGISAVGVLRPYLKARRLRDERMQTQPADLMMAKQD